MSPATKEHRQPHALLPACWHGFTLIEMLMVLALIAILASLAYPSYQRSVRKAHRLDAQTSLQILALTEQRFYGHHGRYSNKLPELGYPDPAFSHDGYYQLLLAPAIAPETGFLASAKPVPNSDQAKDICQEFIYNAEGPVNRPSSPQGCWY